MRDPSVMHPHIYVCVCVCVFAFVCVFVCGGGYVKLFNPWWQGQFKLTINAIKNESSPEERVRAWQSMGKPSTARESARKHTRTHMARTNSVSSLHVQFHFWRYPASDTHRKLKCAKSKIHVEMERSLLTT